MSSVQKLKPGFQNLLRPLARRLAAVGIGADAVTVAAAALSVLIGLALVATRSSWLLLTYPLVLLVRMAGNAVDGMLAREFARPTALGGLLNELGDLVSDAALYLPLALVLPAPPWLVVTIVVTAMVGECAGITASTVGANRRYDGPFGKPDRAVAFSVLAVGTALEVLEPARWLPFALAAMLALAVLTVGNRVRAALVELRP
jgi:CDP-diacylglycerol--glycerol-3-phosphate 3-phosphatidyltransferase